MKGILNDSDISSTEKMTTEGTAFYIQHLLIHEIFNNLPRLEENEKKARDSIDKESIFKKDKLKDCYEFIKKKYTNFIQLAYVDDEQLDEFYNYQNEFDYLKDKVSLNFDFLKFLKCFHYENYDKIPDDKFKTVLVNKFASINILDLVNPHDMWMTISIDPSFVNYKDNDMLKEIFLNLIKYNADLSSDSLIINIKVIYPNIVKDIFSILLNKRNVTRVIITFSDKIHMTRLKNKQVIYEDDEKYTYDINLVMKVILNRLKTYRKLTSLCFVSNKHTIKLNEENSKDLISLLGRENETRVYVLKNILIPESLKSELINYSLNSKHLQFLHFEGIDFNRNTLNEIGNNLNKAKICYFGYDKHYTFDNLLRTEGETEGETPGENKI